MIDWLIVIVIAGSGANMPAITQIPFKGTVEGCKAEASRLRSDLMPRGPGTFYIDLRATCVMVNK